MHLQIEELTKKVESDAVFFGENLREIERKLSELNNQEELTTNVKNQAAEIARLQKDQQTASKKKKEADAEILRLTKALAASEANQKKQEHEIASVRVAKKALEDLLKSKTSLPTKVSKPNPVTKLVPTEKTAMQTTLETMKSTLGQMVDTASLQTDPLQASPAPNSIQTDYDRLGPEELRTKLQKLLAENTDLKNRLLTSSQASQSKKKVVSADSRRATRSSSR